MKMSEQDNHQVKLIKSSAGAEIYQLPVKLFPDFWGYVYLVFVGDFRVLIDTGSGYGECNQHIEHGLDQVRALRSEKFEFSDLTHIFITHGHIDHFAGLNYVLPRTKAKLGVHELDRRNLTNHEERLVVDSLRLRLFLINAGVPEVNHHAILQMKGLTRSIFQSVQTDFTFEAIGMCLEPFEFTHVPGHSAGHVVIKLHDVLFSGDHVLKDTSPHLAPERIVLSTGLEHYLKSLNKLQPLFTGTSITLGGHEDPITDLAARVDEIRDHHRDRLQKVLNFLNQPSTINEVNDFLFGNVNGFDILLSIEETGAHVEYLYQRGFLEIDNLVEFESSDTPIPVCYRCVECNLAKISVDLITNCTDTKEDNYVFI
jgi:glyoxylase-like metal-dependent hydrolase (beta-lactamase superfamily II)